MINIDNFKSSSISSYIDKIEKSGSNINFVVQRYQRKITWDIEKYKNIFLNDEREYFGNMTIKTSKKNNKIICEVVDGQQRLTFFIFSIKVISLIIKNNIDNTQILEKELEDCITDTFRILKVFKDKVEYYNYSSLNSNEEYNCLNAIVSNADSLISLKEIISEQVFPFQKLIKDMISFFEEKNKSDKKFMIKTLKKIKDSTINLSIINDESEIDVFLNLNSENVKLETIDIFKAVLIKNNPDIVENAIQESFSKFYNSELLIKSRYKAFDLTIDYLIWRYIWLLRKEHDISEDDYANFIKHNLTKKEIEILTTSIISILNFSNECFERTVLNENKTLSKYDQILYIIIYSIIEKKPAKNFNIFLIFYIYFIYRTSRVDLAYDETYCNIISNIFLIWLLNTIVKISKKDELTSTTFFMQSNELHNNFLKIKGKFYDYIFLNDYSSKVFNKQDIQISKIKRENKYEKKHKIIIKKFVNEIYNSSGFYSLTPNGFINDENTKLLFEKTYKDFSKSLATFVLKNRIKNNSFEKNVNFPIKISFDRYATQILRKSSLIENILSEDEKNFLKKLNVKNINDESNEKYKTVEHLFQSRVKTQVKYDNTPHLILFIPEIVRKEMDKNIKEIVNDNSLSDIQWNYEIIKRKTKYIISKENDVPFMTYNLSKIVFDKISNNKKEIINGNLQKFKSIIKDVVFDFYRNVSKIVYKYLLYYWKS